MKAYTKTLESKHLMKLRKIDVYDDRIQFSDGSESSHFTLRHPGAVVIIPQLDDDKFLLIRQYRHSVGETILEFPAGTLESGEDPLECAKREIVEEVNHSASEWTSLGTIYPAPGYCNETQYCFLGQKLSSEVGTLDADEIIKVVILSKREIENAIIAGDLKDAKSLSAFLLARTQGLI